MDGRDLTPCVWDAPRSRCSHAGSATEKNRMLTVRGNARAASHWASWTPTAWFTRKGAGSSTRVESRNSVFRDKNLAFDWHLRREGGVDNEWPPSTAAARWMDGVPDPRAVSTTTNHRANQLSKTRSQSKGTGGAQGESNGADSTS